MKAAYGWGSVRVLVVFGVVVLAAGSFASLPARAQASSTPIKVGYLGEQIGGQEMVDNLPAFTAWVKWTNAMAVSTVIRLSFSPRWSPITPLSPWSM